VTRSERKMIREIHTDRIIPIPEKINFAGGNTWE
jgi:hypothetical protein